MDRSQTFGFIFAPRGWALCNGQLLSIAQNTALFSLLGTTYGGDGVTTFALPNLQGRVPIHQGNGVGLTPYVIGQVGGNENVTLTTNQMPMHNHMMNASKIQADQVDPTGAILAEALDSQGGAGTAYTRTAAEYHAAQHRHHDDRRKSPAPQYSALSLYQFYIALVGIFPSRN